MATVTIEPKLMPGQIYHWRWKDAERDADNAPYRSYHCKSQIAVVNERGIYDTFWYGDPRYLDPHEIVLELIGDESWPTIRHYNKPYYDPADLCDMSHSNISGDLAKVYLRPGAAKSADRIRQELDDKRISAESEIRVGQWHLEEAQKQLALLDAGKIDEVRL